MAILTSSHRDVKPQFPQETPRTLANPNRIPRELWLRRQWLVWAYEHDPGVTKPRKPPYNPSSLRKHNSGLTGLVNLRSVVEIYKTNTRFSGIGYYLTRNDPYLAIDVDNCVIGRTPTQFAGEIVDRLSTYTEVSPSGNGVRMIVALPPRTSCRNVGSPAPVELYSHTHYVTLTGNVLINAPIASIDASDLAWLYSLDGTTPEESNPTARLGVTVPAEPIEATPEERQLWAKITAKSATIARIYNGQGDGSPYRDRSAYKLLISLASWTACDPIKMARMIRQYHGDQSFFDTKKPNGETWLSASISRAIAYVQKGQ